MRLAVAAFVVTLAGLLAYAARNPRYEWDVLGYVGVATSWRASGETAHARTYEALREAAPPAVVHELRGSLPYRAAMASDWRAFDDQLGFYRGRIGYTAPIAALSRLGLSPVRAAFALSVVGALLSAFVAFAWCARRAPPWAALGCAWLVLFASDWLETARLATPDALAAAWTLLGAWALLERGRRGLALVAFVLAVLTRADAALLVLALWWADPSPRGRSRAIPLACVAAALLASWASQPYWTVFVHTFHGWLVDPSQAPAFSFGSWAASVATHAGEWLSAPPLFVATGVALVAFARPLGGGSAALRVVLTVAAALALRFALFPALWPRLCQSHVVIAGLVAVGALAALSQRDRHPAATGV